MPGPPSTYFRHLPGIFRARRDDGGPGFLGDYLKIFEALLTGRDDAVAGGKCVAGLEAGITGFVEYLDPALTPVDEPGTTPGLDSEFLTYLAAWVALALDQNWDLERKRQWLRQIVPLYKRRGTKAGLMTYLNMFVGNQVRIDEPPGGFLLAVKGSSTVAVDTFIAGAPAYYFRVRIQYAFGAEPFEIATWRNIRKGARAIIELEKPAHTYYTLGARSPGIVIARRGHATVGRETLIWQDSKPF